MTVYSVKRGREDRITLYSTLEKARAAADEEFESMYAELAAAGHRKPYTGKSENHWLLYVPYTRICMEWFVEEHIVH